MAFQEDFGKMFRPPGAARSDNRDMEGLGNGLGQLAIEACLRAVRIHGSQKDFTGAACFNFASPFQGVQFGLLRAAVSQYSPPWSGSGPALQGRTFLADRRHSPARVDSHNECLPPKVLRNLA